jgi:catechol 2,3-dioxygenase-like lactoylglutathione lyase family enzyme
MRLDSVRIHVAEIDAATRAYELLLGVRASSREGVQRFQLTRGAVELAPGEPGLQSLRFATTGDQAVVWPAEDRAFHGLCVRVCPPPDTGVPAVPHDAVDAIDHIVVHSPDLDRARALWRDRLGLRLALDREFPARGLRMLFFRSGGVTLEFVGTLMRPADPGGADRLYGIAYHVLDLEACRARLLRARLDVGAIRQGHKPGSSVATVRSGTADVPTLLLSTTAG